MDELDHLGTEYAALLVEPGYRPAPTTEGDSDVREFDLADGLRGIEGVKRHRSVVADPAGRIWVSLNHGLSVVDPARLKGDSVPAMVHIEAISADGSPVELQQLARIPTSRQRITFIFAGLSLSVPERVRFRYRLDGFDRDWSDPVTAHEAIYTNLSPGSYSFRVKASNSDGIWNSAEALIVVEIEPSFWQTWWFRLSGVLVCVFAVLALYRFRLAQASRRLNVLYEEHSRAKSIEVEVEYVARHLRILVRDDGCGIDPVVVRSGREGHWGLSGMRERSERIGGRLRVWSRDGMGTEIELSVPSDIAFRFPSSDRPRRWFYSLSRRRAPSDGDEVADREANER